NNQQTDKCGINHSYNNIAIGLNRYRGDEIPGKKNYCREHCYLSPIVYFLFRSNILIINPLISSCLIIHISDNCSYPNQCTPVLKKFINRDMVTEKLD